METSVANISTADSGNDLPFYKPQGNEPALFEHAYRNRLPMLTHSPVNA